MCFIPLSLFYCILFIIYNQIPNGLSALFDVYPSTNSNGQLVSTLFLFLLLLTLFHLLMLLSFDWLSHLTILLLLMAPSYDCFIFLLLLLFRLFRFFLPVCAQSFYCQLMRFLFALKVEIKKSQNKWKCIICIKLNKMMENCAETIDTRNEGNQLMKNEFSRYRTELCAS